MRLSAALSYYSIFSVAPLLLIAVGIAGWVYGERAAQGHIAEELGEFIGEEAASAVQSILRSAGQNSGGATFVGFVTLMVGASSVFGQLRDALNVIWKVKLKEGLGVWHYLRQYVFNLGLVLAVGFLLLISLALGTIVAALGNWLHSRFGIPHFVSGTAAYFIPFVIEILLFAMIFKVLPDVRIRWTDVWIGAIGTALLFEIGKIGLSLYLGRGTVTSSFGAAGSVVLLLLWVYYASCILFFGAEYTMVFARAHRRFPVPTANATPTEIWTGSKWKPAECP